MTKNAFTGIEEYVRDTFKGMTDKSGNPYADHSIRVGEKARTFGISRGVGDSLWVVGVCHDLLEDSATTLDDLRNIGVFEIEIDAIVAVTNKYNDGDKIHESYQDFIQQAISGGFLATVVKFVDVMDNLTRPKHPTFKLKEKLTAVATLSEAMKKYAE